MKEENKRKISYYLTTIFKDERRKYEFMQHKIFVWKQYSNGKELQIKLGRKVSDEHLEKMFELSKLIEWVEKL